MGEPDVKRAKVDDVSKTCGDAKTVYFLFYV